MLRTARSHPSLKTLVASRSIWLSRMCGRCLLAWFGYTSTEFVIETSKARICWSRRMGRLSLQTLESLESCRMWLNPPRSWVHHTGWLQRSSRCLPSPRPRVNANLGQSHHLSQLHDGLSLPLFTCPNRQHLCLPYHSQTLAPRACSELMSHIPLPNCMTHLSSFADSPAPRIADIWSLGCTIIELINGEPPHYDLAPISALYRIVQVCSTYLDQYLQWAINLTSHTAYPQDPRPPFPKDISPLLVDFLSRCFTRDPDKRATAAQLRKVRCGAGFTASFSSTAILNQLTFRFRTLSMIGCVSSPDHSRILEAIRAPLLNVSHSSQFDNFKQ